MVVDQLRSPDPEELDRLFQALADATRRDILTQVSLAERSVSALAALYAMSFAAVQKHVAVLERAGLVRKDKRGREQVVSANHERLALARQVLDRYENLWRERSLRMDQILAETPQETT
ncbi:ArsR/SmtB family transcription factor [Arthrobacter sp. NPDC090010]|uniref:ArsR/SmtB family transcription factor n=1 Tax=Arthrobacter sp. NPDC090010 TaxID=3363942 RepID=UPI003803E524